MKIEDFIDFKKIFLGEKGDLFQEGNLIEGEILDIDKGLVSIHIKDFGVIKAKSEKPLNHPKGKTLSFIIKESSPDKIQLKPILENMEIKRPSLSLNERDEYLLNILKEFNIKASPISLEFLDNLVKFNLPINKENLVYGIGILDKLEQLLNLKEDEAIVLPNSREEIEDIGKEDVRNLLIVKEDESIYKTSLKESINATIEEIRSIVPPNEMGIVLQKAIIFFIKYNIKPTLNNIKYFLELNENLTLFSKDFEKLKEILDKKFTNHLKRIIINSDGSKNLSEKSQSKYNDSLNKILNYLNDYSLNVNENLKDKIEELINKIDFLKEMNKELTFVYLPLNLDDNIQDTVITLLKKNKRESRHKDKLNVFINLNTKRLGNIKISCLVSNIYIDIKFSGINKEDINLFKSREDGLRTLVETTGYEIRAIEYLFEDNYSILDSLIVNRKTIYNLDVQV
ncbi:hypothetical protein CULT_640015 [[Clostridium] ultunense Esp]|uniref:Flagellar hook-length control protein-like C-terminal domain-containing protein n=1 Tax=[Clostridium] ultunense Esp TaxID=1288971 RepID=M1ZLM7_9FIRM|nr:hypothetical protein [Schnuerera ultunensis]CCQ97472.1 hypothetical protein CULT_640015 [[Clostridium] ultunense Esp]SHD76997.1 conserved protein of unknown function [[Clostridium] ultunense Esp]